jgi:hypothetical protein
MKKGKFLTVMSLILTVSALSWGLAQGGEQNQVSVQTLATESSPINSILAQADRGKMKGVASDTPGSTLGNWGRIRIVTPKTNPNGQQPLRKKTKVAPSQPGAYLSKRNLMMIEQAESAQARRQLILNGQ